MYPFLDVSVVMDVSYIPRNIFNREKGKINIKISNIYNECTSWLYTRFNHASIKIGFEVQIDIGDNSK